LPSVPSGIVQVSTPFTAGFVAMNWLLPPVQVFGTSSAKRRPSSSTAAFRSSSSPLVRRVSMISATWGCSSW
jgi:hypothetical protein